jgi:hypothetical protein
MLNVVAYEIVKRRRPSSSFDFSGASIGNLFLTGYVQSLCYSLLLSSSYKLYQFSVSLFSLFRLPRTLLYLLTRIEPLQN